MKDLKKLASKKIENAQFVKGGSSAEVVFLNNSKKDPDEPLPALLTI